MSTSEASPAINQTKHQARRQAPSLRKIVAVSSAGSTIEWYDFFIFGTAAALVFPQLFFPEQTPLIGTLLSFSTFAVGFLSRPLGGIIFGHYGDKVGRKKAFVAALILMGSATAAIGLLPGYASIGVLAPIIVVALRFFQGIAVGGQWGGAVLMAIENAPKNRRGLYGCFPQLGVPLGLLLANGVFILMNLLFQEQFATWGWRVPFLLSVALLFIAYYAHSRLNETAEMEEVHEKHAESRAPIVEVLRDHFPIVALSTGAVVIAGSAFYMYTVYMLAYGTTVLNESRGLMLWAVVAGAALQVPTLLGAAALSDRIGRQRVYLFGALGSTLWAFPAFLLVNTGSAALIILGIVVGQMFFATFYGPQAAFFSELFSARLRYSGASIGYQVGVAFGGASTPIIATALYAQFVTWLPVAAFLAATGVLSVVCVMMLRGRGHTELAAAAEAERAQPALSGVVDQDIP